MKAIIFGEARRNLSATMIQTAEDKAPVMIIRRNGESCVLMSLEEYNSLEETAWLLRSPKNARRLTNAIESLRSSNETDKDIIE
ncbi:YoeB-YefM toxin-antitoxin system antitoxin YefM [Pantoea sp. Bo_2]|uniref:YoeB-YefM toxin-antitoxin system antitoxin YefM n=1 Tax=unclassified Pantoea TaxID=2630326 RepID=UPI0012326656|nr:MULTISPECIES: YoeB-YefM toxin-antitoxin system antitoxin YefM [unclassified Pantoea]KAA5939461.1 YoeB-YefM toxin-antitoxin system antitoxin YefM [Pantoea sp. VH_3]KAA5948429.1 YoeB-YefM toxin-antitoxin system antitoxin YefM [Pantoea sp. VH_25]KAA5951543.1 YoeB-YefM toxin-antitoxin system antitoxin YefM [Pantoea sp. VH_24]KAA5954749.1 YoeB-YefM toxin-antitoxin system antitoxin YefM [Pantoea sp. VH_16]KAA5960566.1 YoeB-YefM toxin-antitoxin system antitoxin YefM [Pantoea sp. VH_18]